MSETKAQRKRRTDLEKQLEALEKLIDLAATAKVAPGKRKGR
jgi:hypothetical protein